MRLQRIKDVPYLFRSEHGVYYVRTKRKGKKPLFESLDTKNQKVAKDLVDERIRIYLGHAAKKVTRLLFKEEADSFLAGYSARVKAQTKKTIENVLKYHVIPFWGSHFLSEITPGAWDAYLVEQSKTGRNLFNDKKAMSLVLHFAHGEGRLEKVPKLTKVDEDSEIGEEYTQDEMLALMGACKSEDLKLAMLIAYKCGPRVGEIVPLRWDEINWPAKYAVMCGKTGPRKVTMGPFVLDALRDAKRRSKSDWVFPMKTDPSRHMSTNLMDGLFQPLKEKVGVTKRFNDLRHTAITGWLRRGMSVVWIAKQVGNSVEQIMRTYEHLKIDDIGQLGEAITLPGEAEFFKAEK